MKKFLYLLLFLIPFNRGNEITNHIGTWSFCLPQNSTAFTQKNFEKENSKFNLERENLRNQLQQGLEQLKLKHRMRENLTIKQSIELIRLQSKHHKEQAALFELAKTKTITPQELVIRMENLKKEQNKEKAELSSKQADERVYLNELEVDHIYSYPSLQKRKQSYKDFFTQHSKS